MVHGAPDNYDVEPKITTYKLTDMAELAERLGHIQSIDRLGEVFFIETFCDGLCHWNTAKAGTGTLIQISGKWSASGGFSLYFHIPLDAAAYGKIYRALPFPVSSKIGVEFCATSSTNLTIFIGYLTFYTSTLKISYGMKFDVPGGKVYYLCPYGTWVQIASGIYISYADHIFHRGKMVIDLPNLEYERYKTASGTINMAGLKPYIVADVTKSHLYGEFYLGGSASGELDIYLDSIIITQNEP